MINVKVTDLAGTEREISAADDYVLMEAIREAGFDDLIAQCGGCCSCATCHVFVDESWMATVGPPNEMEEALLETSEHRQANSRLSCQIDIRSELDGLRVTIAPED